MFKILNHINRLNQDLGATVIMSTHYIEEALKFYRVIVLMFVFSRIYDVCPWLWCIKVGFMHSGYLVIEDSPKRLLSLNCTTSLEDVFFKLCSTENHQIRTTLSKKCEH